MYQLRLHSILWKNVTWRLSSLSQARRVVTVPCCLHFGPSYHTHYSSSVDNRGRAPSGDVQLEVLGLGRPRRAGQLDGEQRGVLFEFFLDQLQASRALVVRNFSPEKIPYGGLCRRQSGFENTFMIVIGLAYCRRQRRIRADLDRLDRSCEVDFELDLRLNQPSLPHLSLTFVQDGLLTQYYKSVAHYLLRRLVQFYLNSS